MKAYRAYLDGENTHELVFGSTAGKARSAAHGLYGLCDAEFTDIKVARVPELDEFFDGNKIVNLDKLGVQRAIRGMGWWINEGLDSCVCCGLYVFDDLSESYINEDDECGECREFN